MYSANVTSRVGHWLINLMIFALIGTTLGIDYNYVDKRKNSSTEEYKSMLSIATILNLILGFIQLQWILNNSQMIAAALTTSIVWIAYFIKFRKEYMKSNLENITVLMLMIIVQALIGFKVNDLLSGSILVTFIIYELMKFMEESNYDNWSTIISLLVICSTIAKINSFILICIYIVLIVLVKIAINKVFFGEKLNRE